jgi:hypothetical protein
MIRAKKKTFPRFLNARRDARLKNLPPEKRDLIIEWFNSPGGVPYCLRQIKRKLGISVKYVCLYQAIQFWKVERRFQEVEAQARVMMEHEAERDPEMTPEQRDAAIDQNFVMLAAASGDTETLIEFRKLGLKRQELATRNQAEDLKLKQREKELDRKERELALAIQKFQFDGAKAALKEVKALRAIAADRSLNSAAKVEAVRLKLWGPAPEVKA